MKRYRTHTAFIILGFVVLLSLSGCGILPREYERGGTGSPSPSPSSSSEMHSPTTADPAVSSSAVPESPSRTPTPSRLQKVKFHSGALDHDMRMNVYLPPGYDEEKSYPVLYILHGYFGTESAWMPEIGLEKAADRLIADKRIEPLIIVAPEMDNSYGLNSADKYTVVTPSDPAHSRYYGRYEDYFVQDVIGYVDAHYRTVAAKEGRYVGGFSMGGWASLHFAFRHPDLFGKAGGHSAALWTDDWSRVPRMKSWLYPTAKKRKERDPIELARTQDLDSLSVYLDCGDADDYKLYNGSRKLFDILQARGVPSEYHLNPGGHSRNYLKSHLEEYLLFYAGKPSDSE